MDYTIEQMNGEIREINNELETIRINKGHDYSGTQDTLDNLRDFGFLGVVVRIGDKYKRLKHFCKQGTLSVKDESIEDTCKDLINYALFALILHRQDKPDKVDAFETTMNDMNKQLGELK